MAEDDYDLLPHQEIKRLRDQIKNLKSQLGQKDVKPSSLQGSVDTLNESMKLLITIFQEASKNIEGEPHKATHEHLDGMNTHLDNLNSKMEQLLKHNEEIAKGILVVANLNKESIEKIINNLIGIHKTNFKGVGQPLRIALVGSKFGPGIYDIILSLEKNEVLKRLKAIV